MGKGRRRKNKLLNWTTEFERSGTFVMLKGFILCSGPSRASTLWLACVSPFCAFPIPPPISESLHMLFLLPGITPTSTHT